MKKILFGFRNFSDINLRMMVREKKNVNLQKIRFTASFKPKVLKPLLNNHLSMRLFESMYETRK